MSGIKEKVDGFINEVKSIPFSSPIASSSKTTKQSEDGDKMKVKLMEKWNKFKFGKLYCLVFCSIFMLFTFLCIFSLLKKFKLETDQYIDPPIFDLLNIGRYANFYRCFDVLVFIPDCTKFILI